MPLFTCLSLVSVYNCSYGKLCGTWRGTTPQNSNLVSTFVVLNRLVFEGFFVQLRNGIVSREVKGAIYLMSSHESLISSEPLFESSLESLFGFLCAGLRFFDFGFLMMKSSCSKILDNFSSVQGFSTKKSTP